jgi:GT2 family glycosyltransferase
LLQQRANELVHQSIPFQRSVGKVIMQLSILIVNYNGKKYLGDCLSSIKQFVTAEHEVILVDNASGDGSVEYVRNTFPEVKVIISDRNLGFAGGNNLGAHEASGKYLLLLNNDTKLLTDINPAIDLLEDDHSIGIAGAMMLDGDEKYSVSAGHFPSPPRLVRIASVYKSDGYFRHGNFPQHTQRNGFMVDWVAGSFLLMQRSLWQRLGGLDDSYFMYGEDVDFCRRMLDEGLLTAYCPTVRYVHYCGFDSSRLPLIIKGFRRYHQKFSNVFSRTAADGILFSGLILRALVYGLLFVITGKQDYGVKTKACRAALVA